MNREQIIQMARDARLGNVLCHNSIDGDRIWIEGADWDDEIMAFAAAIRSATKEEDARIADSFYQHIRQYTTDVPDIGGAIRASK